MIYYLVARKHAHTMLDFLAGWGRPFAGRIRILLYEDLFSGASWQLPAATYIFTSMGRDMGSREPPSPVRKLCSELRLKLVQTCGPQRVLNDPARFMSRFDLLQSLHGRGINRFGVHRVAGEAPPPRYPVFVRREGGTVWETPPLVRDPGQYTAAARAAEPGSIAIEYLDTADAAGVYRKYGCFVVGGHVVPRHLFFSRNWLVKEADLLDPALLEEEFEFMSTNPHASALAAVARLANLSWGRIDYALVDGRPQIWEFNITPALVSGPPEGDPARRRVHEKFVELFARALDAVDPPAA